jgi:endonuclease/exonuclease/phosphatase family metal-dependent hydrolase
MPKLVTTNMSINNGDVERRYNDFNAYCAGAKPDIITVQEVSADVGFSALQSLAKALGHDYTFYYDEVYPGQEDTQGVGVVTRLEAKNEPRIFDSGHGRNLFQVIGLSAEGNRQLMLANVHMEAHLFLDRVRRRKIESLITRLGPGGAHILAGDFNAIPRFPSIKYLSKRYRSAHKDVHGREPSHTYPTDLGEDLLLNNGDATRRQIMLMKLGAKACQKAENRRPSGLPRVVADYVFVNQLVRVDSARLTGHDEAHLAHSDHRGLEIDFALN